MGVGRCIAVCVVVCVVGLRAEPARVAGEEVRLWTRAGTLEYSVESGVLCNEAARRDQEVGWRVAATLAVRALACVDQEALLHFQLRSPELRLRGAARHSEWVARESLWSAPAHRDSSFYAHWRRGELVAVFLDPADLPAVAGFKRGLLSLFQFQILDGERNETDISGDCDVFYETLNEHEFRKIKRGCRWAGVGDSDSEGGVGGVTSRWVTRYTLRGALDAVSAALAEEVHEIAAAGAGDADAAVKVRSWLRLQLAGETGAGGACAGGAAGLASAVAALPTHYTETTLVLPSTDPEEGMEFEAGDEEAPLSAEAALALAGGLAAPAAGEGGDEAAARTMLRVLPALQAAPAPALLDPLLRLRDNDALTGAMRALGAAGTAAALEAAAAALQLRAEPLRPAAAAYLAALGGARAPQAAAVRGALALAGDAACPRVRRAALLAAAAAAPRAPPPLADRVRDELARQLARCKEDECRCALVAALGNLRRADTAALLLGLLQLGGGAALCAARALPGVPRAALTPPRADALLLLALNRTASTEVRAAALELGVRALERAPAGLAGAARALLAERSGAAHELRRVLWARVAALAERRDVAGERARLLLAAARTDPQLGSWDARAHAGTSSVLVREAGWGGGGWAARLDSSQLAAGGVLRRGVVTLAVARDGDGGADPPPPALAVEVWTRGLHALAGGGGEGAGEGEGEEAAGGLALELAGARLPDITLFESQAELLGHVWSGAGSAPTSVLRAALSLGARARVVPLCVGARARLRAAAAAALALDAHVAVSLWARTAAARLALRAAVAGEARTLVPAPWGRVTATAAAHAPADFSISADLDFYSRVSLCVRAALDAHELTRSAALRSELGARRWRVSRARRARTPRPPRTLALGPANDAACRLLAPAE